MGSLVNGIRRKLTALVADSSDFVAECFLQGVLLWSTMQWQSFFFHPLRSKPTPQQTHCWCRCNASFLIAICVAIRVKMLDLDDASAMDLLQHCNIFHMAGGNAWKLVQDWHHHPHHLQALKERVQRGNVTMPLRCLLVAPYCAARFTVHDQREHALSIKRGLTTVRSICTT